jgi:hypothetical protein
VAIPCKEQRGLFVGNRNYYTGTGVSTSMSFHDLFPATTWVWRKLRSRPARRLYISGIAVIVIPALALRIQAAMFEARVLTMVHALSNLRVGASSRADALTQIPTLRTNQPDQYGGSRCGTDECLSAGIATSDFTDSVLRKAADHDFLFSLLSWWGFRGGYLDVHADFTSGKVSSLGYQVMVTTAHLDYSGAVVVGVSSVQHMAATQRGSGTEVSRTYSVEPARKSPLQSVGIRLTPQAPIEIVNPAFNPKLGCLWSLTGCRTWHEILPSIERRGT